MHDPAVHGARLHRVSNRSLPPLLVLLLLLLPVGSALPTSTDATGSAAVQTAGAAVQPEARPAVEPGTGLDAYAAFLGRRLEQFEELIPTMTQTAQEAAKLYIDAGWDIGVIGDPGAYFESTGRSGGLMTVRAGWSIQDIAKDQAVVLLSLREDQWRRKLHRDVAFARDLSQSGQWKVIGIGRPELIEKAEQEGVDFMAKLPVPAAEGEGLFAVEGGERLVPTSPALKVVAMWMWFGEFVSACTRQGAMPPMYMGYAIEGGEERAGRLQGQRLHEQSPPPVEAGVLARQYLDIVRGEIEQLFETQRTTMIAAAQTLAEAQRNGHNLWGFYHNHALVMGQSGYPHQPDLIRQINKGWFDMRVDLDELGDDDVILCIGFDRRFNGWKFESWDEDVRGRGVTLIWSFAPRRREDVEAIERAGEPLIEQPWAHGDAVLEVPGYDIKILPTSGVICHAVLWGMHAELLTQLKDARVVAGE